MHKLFTFFVGLFILACSQSRFQLNLEELYLLSQQREIDYSLEIVDTLDQSQLLISDIYSLLQKTLDEENPVLAMPKLENLIELRRQFPHTLMFDRNGRQVQSNICFAHYPNPLFNNVLQFDRPRVINSELSLSEFLFRMDFIKGNVCDDGIKYDYYLFYTWGHSREGDLPRMQAEMHQNLAKQLPDFHHKIKLINLYIGNHRDFNMSQKDFNEYFKRQQTSFNDLN